MKYSIKTNIFSASFPYRAHLLIIVPSFLLALLAAILGGWRFPSDIFADFRNQWPWVSQVLHGLSESVNYISFAVVAWLVLDAYGKKNRRQQLFCLFLAVGIVLIANGFAGLLKYGLGMPRPGVSMESIPWSGLRDYHSFPSGHMSRILSLFIPVALWLHKKWVTILLSLFAMLIVASRFWLGQHHPMDIMGGIVIGLMTAWFAFAFLSFDEEEHATKQL